MHYQRAAHHACALEGASKRQLCQKSKVTLQGLLEHKLHFAVEAYSGPMPMRIGPPYERCRTLEGVAKSQLLSS